jgi:hypothetical protein
MKNHVFFSVLVLVDRIRAAHVDQAWRVDLSQVRTVSSSGGANLGTDCFSAPIKQGFTIFMSNALKLSSFTTPSRVYWARPVDLAE